MQTAKITLLCLKENRYKPGLIHKCVPLTGIKMLWYFS